ncbi:MAG: DUF4157 domain-containing protein, partial [Bradyrhizobium icense]
MGRLAAPAPKVQRAAKGRGPRPAPTVQAQLAINPPGDRFEHEADRIASQVVRSSGPAAAPPPISRVDSSAQRAVVPAAATIESTGKPKEQPKKEEAQRAPLQRAPAKRDEKVQRASHGDKEADKPLQRAPAKRDDKVQRASHGDKQAEKPLQRAPAKRDDKVQRASHGDKEADKPLQRASAKRDDKVQRKAARPEDKVQRAEAANTSLQAPANVEQNLAGMRGRGEGMAPELRTQMEQGFGRSFGDVRLHRSPAAGDAAQALNARAFTVGNDVFFGRGEYQPHSQAGQHLIAHELTHTVQQTGGARTVQRAVPPAGTDTQKVEKKTWPESGPADLGQIELGKTPPGAPKGLKNTITLPVLRLPYLGALPKGASNTDIGVTGVSEKGQSPIPAAGGFKLFGMTERDNFVAADKWVADMATKVGNPAVQAIKANYGEANLKNVGNESIYYLKAPSSSQKIDFLNGTAEELGKHPFTLLPSWDRDGTARTFQADHFHELQLGGAEADPANLWLLESKLNQGIGNSIKSGITGDVRDLLKAAKQDGFWDKSNPEPNPTAVKHEWAIIFQKVEKDKNRNIGSKSDQSNFWTQGDILEARQFGSKQKRLLRPMTDQEMIAKGLKFDPTQPAPDPLLIFQLEGGGRYGPLLRKGKDFRLITYGGNPKPGKEPHVGIVGQPGYPRFQSAELVGFDPDYTKGEGAQFGAIEVTLYKQLTRRGVIARQVDVNIPVLWSKRLGFHVYTDLRNLNKKIADAGVRVRGLSPVEIQSTGFDQSGEFVVRGVIVPTPKFLQKYRVPFILTEDELRIEFPLDVAGLDFGPVSVTDASLAVMAGQQGLGLSGEAGIEIKGLGRGRLQGLATTGGEADKEQGGGEAKPAGDAKPAASEGPMVGLSGTFDFDFDKFDPAQIKVAYLNDQWSADATLGLKPNTVRGISAAQVHVTADDTGLKVDGTATLDVPGLQGTQLSVKRDQTGNLDIGADHIPLPVGKIPGVKGGEASVHAVRQADSGEWTLKGSGTAQFGVPGVSGALTIGIDGQLVTVQGSAAIQRGLMSGQASFLATNRPLDPSGQPIDGPPGDLQASGEGKVTLQLGRFLQGTAGLRFKPDGEMEIMGQIALPPTVD